jgi:hypothetical protein
MTQPQSLPADPFPDFASIYDTPVIKAFRIEPGRYLTVDLDGVEIVWLSESDSEIVAIASSIGHRVVCTVPRCKHCATDLETYNAEAYGFVRTSRPELELPIEPATDTVQIPRQRMPDERPVRRGWLVAVMVAASGIGMALSRRAS